MRRLQGGIELTPGGLRAVRMELHTGELAEAEELSLGSGLPAFLSRLGAERGVAVSPPPALVASRFVELPAVKKALQEGALRSRIKKYLDFREDLHSLSYRETTAQGRPGFLVTLLGRAFLDETMHRFTEAGIAVRRVELAHSALLRWAFWEWPELRKGTRLLAFLRPGELLVVGHSDGSLFFARTARLDLPEGAGRELQACLVHLRSSLCEEPVEPEEVVLVGEGLDPRALAGRLGLPVGLREGRRLFTAAGIPGPGEQVRWAVAAGLALRALEETL